ncbi:MAG: hypothetical protein NTX11_03510 [Candidatus Saccharibacteria bacterium]|nr:hypothetical protein [Candidatus Saccharibacteria bacterium]
MLTLKGYSEDEILRFVQLRAMEWSSWPAFLSMGIGVFLLLKFGILHSILIVMSLNFVWTIFCKYIVNATIANYGVFVKKLMWVTCPGVSIYFFAHNNIKLAVVALFWGIISMFLQIARFPGSAKVGDLERIFYSQISK